MCAFSERKHTEDVVFPQGLFTEINFYSDFGFFISLFL